MMQIICSWLETAGRRFDIYVMQQSQGGAFNKGALFNAGVALHPDYDYYVLHDVDQVPILSVKGYIMYSIL